MGDPPSRLCSPPSRPCPQQKFPESNKENKSILFSNNGLLLKIPPLVNLLGKTLKPLVKTIYVDLAGRFLCPDIITGASPRPDVILIDSENKMYVVELTVDH